MPVRREILTTRKRKHSRRSRGRSRGHKKRGKRHSAWTRTLAKHRSSRSPFTYKGRHYHWRTSRGKNGTTLVYPKRGSRPTRKVEYVTAEQPSARKSEEYDETLEHQSNGSESDVDSLLSDIMRDDLSEANEVLTTLKAASGPFEFFKLVLHGTTKRTGDGNCACRNDYCPEDGDVQGGPVSGGC